LDNSIAGVEGLIIKKMLCTCLLVITVSTLIACSNNDPIVTNQSHEATTPEIAVPEPIELEVIDPESATLEAERGDNVDVLVPEGWHIVHSFEDKPQQVDGDLNQDGISDIALVIEEDRVVDAEDAEDSAPSRSLIVAFGKENLTYILSIKADKAILKADEGGIWGDPFVGISIDRGSLLIDFYGGSSWRWYGTYRFRYQDNDWFMIGATQGFSYTLSLEESLEEDFNLLTGEYIQKKSDENGMMKEVKSNRGKKKLLKLSEFDASSIPDF
jgi:hypothetical protein